MQTFLRSLLTTLAATVCISAFADSVPESARGSITTRNLVPTGTATANSCVELRFMGMGSAAAQVTGTYTGALSLQRTADGSTWETLSASSTFTDSAGTSTATITSGTTGTFILGNVAGSRSIRVCGLAAMTGTAAVALQSTAAGGSSGGSSGISIADGADAGLGSTTDAAATAGGTGTISAKMRLATSQLDDVTNAITATNTQLPPSTGTQTIANSMSVTPATSATFTVAGSGTFTTNEQDVLALSGTGSCTSSCNGTTLLSGTTDGYQSIQLQLTAAGTGTVQFQCSDDNNTWIAGCVGYSVVASSTLNSSATQATAVGGWTLPAHTRYFRWQFIAYSSGTFTAVGYMRKAPFAPVTQTVHVGSIPTVIAGGQAAHGATISGNPIRLGVKALTANVTAVTTGQVADLISTTVGVQITKPFSIPEADWNYAAASGGISNTNTAVTIKAAAAAGIKNYVTSIDLMCEALTNATEVAIRDGAGGTVLWRTKVGTGGLTGGRHVYFPNPLSGTAATLLEVLTITASGTGACYFNASGYAAP